MVSRWVEAEKKEKKKEKKKKQKALGGSYAGIFIHSLMES